MLNNLLEPPPFLLAEQYAAALTTLGVAMCWMPVLPISPFIAVVGLLLAYWADKFVALRCAKQAASSWAMWYSRQPERCSAFLHRRTLHWPRAAGVLLILETCGASSSAARRSSSACCP